MKIKKINIHNYKSIKDLELFCEPYVVMVGPNNHGKSNVLLALEFFMTSSAKPVEKDFFVGRGAEKALWVEVTFHELTAQEQTTFKQYLRANGEVCIRKTANLTDASTVESIYNGYIQESAEPWLKEESVSELAKRTNIDQTPLKDLVPESGKITQAHVRDAQSSYITQNRDRLTFTEVLQNSPLLGAKNVAAGVLPDFYLIPAVRDLSDETKIKTTSAFGRLLNRAVREMAERDPRFSELKQGLDKLVKTLNHSEETPGVRPEQLIALENSLKVELEHWGVKVEIEVVPPDIDKIFELGTNLHLDDGVKTLAEQKGHGLQRAVIFALVRAWANALRAPVSTPTTGTVPRASSESIIFAMEEPELFLHPHAQRRLARAIRQISETANHQVLICSHSTHFIDLDKYKNVCIVSKQTPSEGTKVRQHTADLFEESTTQERKNKFHMAQWINPDRAEMFFAKRVALVEGETEKTIFPFLAQKMNCLDQDVSVVDCGSKHNLKLYIAIANAFKIPYIVVHDQDPLPNPIPSDWDEDKKREKSKTFELNAEIIQSIDNTIGKVEMLSPDFEGVAGVSRTQGNNKGKALAALDYFDGKTEAEIPLRLKGVVTTIFS